MISRCKDLNAIEKGELRAAEDIDMSLFTLFGWIRQKDRADMPPIDGPITVCKMSIFKAFNNSEAAFAISSTDKTGNESRYC